MSFFPPLDEEPEPIEHEHRIPEWMQRVVARRSDESIGDWNDLQQRMWGHPSAGTSARDSVWCCPMAPA